MSRVSSRLIIKTHEQWSINNFYLKVTVIFKVVSSLDVCKKLFIFKKEVTPKSYRKGVSLSSSKTRWSLYWKHYSIVLLQYWNFFFNYKCLGIPCFIRSACLFCARTEACCWLLKEAKLLAPIDWTGFGRRWEFKPLPTAEKASLILLMLLVPRPAPTKLVPPTLLEPNPKRQSVQPFKIYGIIGVHSPPPSPKTLGPSLIPKLQVHP